jgi:hypothetical protein
LLGVSRLERVQWVPCLPAGRSLIAGPSLPDPGPREISPKVPGDSAFSAPRLPPVPSKPVEFPVFSLRIKEPSPRDGFAPDWPHRHVVRQRGDRAPVARHGSEIGARSRGFGRAASPEPNRRLPGEALTSAVLADRLCSRVGRFGFARRSLLDRTTRSPRLRECVPHRAAAVRSDALACTVAAGQ